MDTAELGRALWRLVEATDARNDLVAVPEPIRGASAELDRARGDLDRER